MKYWVPAAFMFMPLLANADQENAPYAYVKASDSGTCILKMVPGSKPSGTAYKISENGALEEQWRVEGWYSFEVYVSNNCQHLIRLERSPRLYESPEKDVVLWFYKGGKLVKLYKSQDLIRDQKNLLHSKSHYQWQINTQYHPSYEEMGVLEGFPTFKIKTIEKQIITFNVATGEILESYSQP
jgi:hypothetical protein